MKKLWLVVGCVWVVGMVAVMARGWFSSSSKAENPSASSGLTRIGFSKVGAESDWRMANTKSMKMTFSEKNGYELLVEEAQQKQSRQVASIRNFIARGVDYIVVAPVTEEGWDDVLREVKEAKIPLIIVDRMIKSASDDLYTCWVGSDFRKEGDVAVQWMEENLGRERDLKIVHLQGTMGSSAQIGRTAGLQAGLERNPAWHVVVSDSGSFTHAKGKEIMEQMLRQHPYIDVLYSENDNMTFGAMEAMDEAHRSYGLRGEITVISFDATQAGLTATLQGKINYNVECNPLHGPRVEEIIRRLQNGEQPEKFSYVDEMSFDARHITQADLDAREY